MFPKSRTFGLRLEVLESREVPATFTWHPWDNPADSNWSTRKNWYMDG